MTIPLGLGVSDTASAEAFVGTSEGLRTVLRIIDRIGPDGWDVLPVAQVLIRFTQKRFTPVARAWHRPPEDATYAAFLAMRSRSVRTAADPWAVVTRAVELSLQAETTAERSLISPEKARRPVHRPALAPVRAGEHEEFLYDVIATGQDVTRPGERVERLVAVTAAFLVLTGWDHDQARRAAEYLSSRAADLDSHASALDVLRRDDPMRERLALPPRAWNRLLVLLIGPKPRAGRPAELGLFGRVLRGDSLTDLLRDPALLDLARGTVAGATDG